MQFLTDDNEFRRILIDDASFFILQSWEKSRYLLIDEMVKETLNGKGYSQNEIRKVSESVLIRDKMRSTGIGGGMAIPHTKGDIGCTPILKDSYASWFLVKDGIDFEAVDCKLVYLLCLLLADKVDIGIRLLSQTSLTGLGICCKPGIDILTDIEQIETPDELRLLLSKAFHCRDLQ